jgi:hypothetical protein
VYYLFVFLSHIGYEYSAGELLDLVATQSVWTIDLAFLLRKTCPDLCFLFCTTALGVVETHAELEMYRNEFENDSSRCRRLFATASDFGVPCLEASLDRVELGRLMLARRVVLIVLVDITKINTSRYSSFSRYTGHYIVICGYDSVTQEFSYLDPAQSSTVRTISAELLDTARLCEGTDEDIVIIQLPAYTLGNRELETYASGLDRLEGWRRSAFEASDHFFDSADSMWGSILSGIAAFGRQEDSEGNELKIL